LPVQTLPEEARAARRRRSDAAEAHP
jgi:hypothetical protein